MGQTQARRLSQDEVEDLLRRSRHFSRDNVLSMYRQFRQDFPSGYITRDAFLRSFKRNFPNDIAGGTEFCEQLFRAHDTDGNDRVEFGEFVLSLDIALHGTAEEKLRWAFRMYDRDGNGIVTITEITNILKAIYCLKRIGDASRRAERNALTLMRELDLDSSSTLSRDEFVKAATRRQSLVDIVNGKN